MASTVFAFCSALGTMAAPAPGDTVLIGTQRELFVDAYLVEDLSGAQLVLHHPVPREIAIVHDKPWEGGTCAYHTVFRDGDLYRMYYRGGWGWKVYCYAESADGILWTKPNLDLFELKDADLYAIRFGQVREHP